MAGGAGFLGSHVCQRLLERGDEVVCVDDLSTGAVKNVDHLREDRRFALCIADVSRAAQVGGPVDAVFHLASPASPPAYLARPLATLSAGSDGTRNLLELASRHGATFLLASTSEVYGDPEVHPQPESYRGHVDPVGPRSVYDEAKRYAEALTMAYSRSKRLEVRIARIFNTYGPRLSPDDGRVVSNFVAQALSTRPLTVYGDGSQTRSLCYVDDMVEGLLALVDGAVPGPVNLGNPDERSVADIAEMVLELTGSKSTIEHRPLPVDDPRRRCPDIGLAREVLGWTPSVRLDEGLRRTIDWFAPALGLGTLH